MRGNEVYLLEDQILSHFGNNVFLKPVLIFPVDPGYRDEGCEILSVQFGQDRIYTFCPNLTVLFNIFFIT